MRTNQSTTRLKSRHIQNKSAKIKLTDLCPQQKAKIGQLIKALETLKNQNLALKGQIESLTDTTNSLKKQKQSFLDQNNKNLQNIAYLEQQVRVCQNENMLKDKIIKQLKQSITNKPKSATKLSVFVQTDQLYKLNVSTQTKIRRKKNKQKSIQTEFQIINQRGFNTFRPKANSKSFQKIMSSKYSLQYMKGQQKDQQNEEDEKDSPNYNKYRKQILDEVENEEQDSENQGFQQLAQKWLQIKQKNMSKMKEEYKDSKKKVLRSQNNYTDFSNQSSQLNARLKQLEQKQSLYQNKHRPFRQKTVDQQEQMDEQLQDNGLLFDDIELNKVLKSKNFSASRLISSQTSNSNAKSRQRVDNSRSRQKSKRSIPSVNAQGFGTSARHKQVDFYEPDLFDLVASIQKNT